MNQHLLRATTYYHGDQLNSATTLTNSNGGLVSRQVLSPFGRRLAATGSDPIGLAGNRLDPLTGLYHMGAREMNPSSGLFITPDPSSAPDAEKPQTLNRYAYANNSPTNLVDLTGYAATDSDSDKGSKDDRASSGDDSGNSLNQKVYGSIAKSMQGNFVNNGDGVDLNLYDPGSFEGKAAGLFPDKKGIFYVGAQGYADTTTGKLVDAIADWRTKSPVMRYAPDLATEILASTRWHNGDQVVIIGCDVAASGFAKGLANAMAGQGHLASVTGPMSATSWWELKPPARGNSVSFPKMGFNPHNIDKWWMAGPHAPWRTEIPDKSIGN